MKAIVIPRAGGPEVLERREVPDPVAGPDEVLVRVHATALNRADVLQRRGLYPAPPGVPAEIPGLEFAGEVLETGNRATTLRPGDRVMGIVGGGAHAERLAIHERLCLRIPPGLGFEQAAAIPEAYLTAFDALLTRGRLRPGESVLVQAAGSGVGTAACRLALECGARVIATSRRQDKRARLSACGVDTVLDPSEDDFAGRVRLAAGGEGVDLAIDFLGASALPLHLEVLASLGRLVVVGTLGGSSAAIDLGVLLRKRITIVGTVLRARPIEEKIELTRRFDRTMLPLLALGRLTPDVDRVVSWREVAEAHAAMERNENFGKIVLRVD